MAEIVCDKVVDKICDYQAKAICADMPLAWGEYCEYELTFIQERYDDLVLVFDAIAKRFGGKDDRGVAVGFRLNHTILYEICFIYANDLKPVRQFHAIEGGCDRNRRAAFLARLIAMHRPVQIDEFVVPDTKALQDDFVLKLNELFALNALMHFLILPASFFGDTRVEKVALDLLFTFGHRDPQPESLVCIARLLTGLHGEFQRAEKAEKELAELLATLDQSPHPPDRAPS